MTNSEKIDLFLQQEISKRSENSLLRELYERKSFSNVELLYLFPNNKLKSHGIPMKRGGPKKRKKIYRRLFDQRLFNIVEDMIDKLITKQFENNSFFKDFVEIKNISFGDEVPAYMGIETYAGTNFKRITKYT